MELVVFTKSAIKLLFEQFVDDPLIRCLFNDAIGAYQAAQLQRLLARPEGNGATR